MQCLGEYEDESLLSVSELIKVHFEVGIFYMMVPDGDRKRRVNLIEDNGLYVLPFEVLLPAVKERKSWRRWMDKVVAFVGTRSSKRAKESKNGDARRVEEASEDSKSPVKQREAIPGAIPHGSHAPEASIELWHKRFGCSKQKIKLMEKQSSVEGMNVKCLGPGCDRYCACDRCRLARATKSSTRKD